MKREVIIGTTIVMLISLLAIPVGADDSASITINLLNDATADIVLNNTVWNPTAGLGETEETGLSHFNIENNGSVQVDIDIKGAVTGGWNLGSAPGHNILYLAWNYIGATWTEIETIDTSFRGNLAHDEDQDFGLHLEMPLTTGTADTQTITVTFTAIAD